MPFHHPTEQTISYPITGSLRLPVFNKRTKEDEKVDLRGALRRNAADNRRPGNGGEEECAVTPEDELSPLFTGGKADLPRETTCVIFTRNY